MFGTEFKLNQYVLLPESTNVNPSFGKVRELLCCQENGYLVILKTYSEYCQNTDLFMVFDLGEEDVVQLSHLADYHPLEGSALFSLLNVGKLVLY